MNLPKNIDPQIASIIAVCCEAFAARVLEMNSLVLVLQEKGVLSLAEVNAKNEAMKYTVLPVILKNVEAAFETSLRARMPYSDPGGTVQ